MLATCVICDRGAPLGVIAEYQATWVTASEQAPLPGYVCVVSKTHVVEPFELAEPQRSSFWEECMTVAAALKRLLDVPKLNYEIHGNTIPHLHMHIYPRYPGDPYEGRPIEGSGKFRRTPAELRRIAEALVEAEHGAL